MANPILRDWKMHGLIPVILRSRFLRPLVTTCYEIIYWHSYAWSGTKWLGVPAMKYPADAWTCQEIIFETRPDLIIETGTHRGGSALFLATICDAIDRNRMCFVSSRRTPRS